MFRKILVAIATITIFTSHAAAHFSFENYPVAVKSSQPFKPDIQSSEFGRKFKTRIRDAAQNIEPNFAGHYILTEWGCGTECQSGAIINALTGEVHQLPTSEWGRTYRLDSNLLIENDVDFDSVDYIPGWLEIEYHVWTGEEFVRVHTEKPQAVDSIETSDVPSK